MVRGTIYGSHASYGDYMHVEAVLGLGTISGIIGHALYGQVRGTTYAMLGLEGTASMTTMHT